jgi:hypothetical protein
MIWRGVNSFDAVAFGRFAIRSLLTIRPAF